MARFGIGETHYEGEKQVEMAIQCRDEPDGPLLYEGKVAPVSAVVRRLKQGDAVEVNWRLPGGSNEASIEVQRGQTQCYRMINLPRLDVDADD